MMHPTAKVSEGTNRNMPVRNTLVQLLALCTNPESQNAQRYRQTDGRMGRRQDYANSWSYWLKTTEAPQNLTEDQLTTLGLLLIKNRINLKAILPIMVNVMTVKECFAS